MGTGGTVKSPSGRGRGILSVPPGTMSIMNLTQCPAAASAPLTSSTGNQTIGCPVPRAAVRFDDVTEPGGNTSTTPIGSRAAAEGYVEMVCFKHGPPQLQGVELEWTVHHADDPHRPLDAALLSKALGAHAPATLVPGSPQLPLGRGALVTVEPGGQVEISGPASASVTRLIDDTAADAAELTSLLATAGLVPGRTRPGRLPAAPPHPDRPALRGDGARVRAARVRTAPG